MSKIESALSKLFENNRLVFWYDPTQEMQDEFEAVNLPEIKKIEVGRQTFGIKYRLLREEPKQKFLLYFPKDKPTDADNWLLDLELANAVFSADKASIYLFELGLPADKLRLIKEHLLFLNADGRRQALAKRLLGTESERQILLQMMAVCLGGNVEAKPEKILLALLENLAEDQSEKYEQFEKFGLLPQLWKELDSLYNYQSQKPHIEDFAIKLFESGFKLSLNQKSELNHEAIITLDHWKDSAQAQASFEKLSAKYEKALQINEKIAQNSLQELLACDLFKAIDRHILEELTNKLVNENISEAELLEISRQRKGSYWYRAGIEAAYLTLEKAVSLLSRIATARFEMESLEAGFKHYVSDWYRIDQDAREVRYYMRRSGQTTLFSALQEKIDAQYVNNALLLQNNRWQSLIDKTESWTSFGDRAQRQFFAKHVQPILDGNAKLAVIISDALRYEVAEVICRKIEEEGRFTTDLDWMAGQLPSYTALGMAALLPNRELEILPDGSVKVDGMNSAGIENRRTILKNALQGKAFALTAKEFINLTTDERRTLFSENALVYLYHNRIDMVGDKQESEDQTGEAVQESIEELVNLVKALRNANFAKIMLTADHGFLYQSKTIHEADLNSPEISGQEVWKKKRRFVVGKGLKNEGNLLKFFSAEALGLAGESEVLLAKSINRMRLSGAGMQFVHGGSSLQEIVIPLLSVNRARGVEFGAQKVKVDRIQGASDKITTGQLTVKFIQTEKVSTKVLARLLRVAIYAQDGSQISNSETLSFDSESESLRDWEVSAKFILSKNASNYNRQNVELRLEELIPNTEKYQLIQKWSYYLNRTEFMDF